MSSNGCTIRVAPPPYHDRGDFVITSVSGHCDHMGSGDTGEFQTNIDGADHGESNDVPRFDADGNFSSQVDFSQKGDVCGHQGTIVVRAKYDFNNNLSVSGSTTFKVVCDS